MPARAPICPRSLCAGVACAVLAACSSDARSPSVIPGGVPAPAVPPDAGLDARVEARVDAQRRLYRVRLEPLVEIDHWLEPYLRLWEQRLDRLEDHLDGRRMNR